MNNQLNASQIENLISARPVPVIRVFRTLDSTQTYSLKHQFVSPHLIVADQQTAGRGQRGHHFYAPRTSGIYMTVTLPVMARFVANPGLLTAGLGVTVISALQPFVKSRLGLKWMNDIECRHRKCGGLLVETNSNSVNVIQSFVIGLGLNLFGSHFSGRLKQRAGNLFKRRPPVSRNRLIAELYDQIVNVNHVGIHEILNDYQKLMIWKNRKVSFRLHHQIHSGVILGVDDHARLVVKSHRKIYHLNYQSASQIRLA